MVRVDLLAVLIERKMLNTSLFLGHMESFGETYGGFLAQDFLGLGFDDTLTFLVQSTLVF